MSHAVSRLRRVPPALEAAAGEGRHQGADAAWPVRRDVVGPALNAAGGLLQPMAAALAEPGAAEARLKRLYGVETLDGFGALAPAEVSALGLLAAYLETTQPGKAPALSAPRRTRFDLSAALSTIPGDFEPCSLRLNGARLDGGVWAFDDSAEVLFATFAGRRVKLTVSAC